ncbi:MAG TPA: FAD-binding protein [Galbitalea sp.]|jgi:hypothetical protein
MVELSRRHVFVLAAVGLVTAGCAPVVSAHTATPRPPSKPSSSPTPAGPPDWSALASGIAGSLSRAGGASYNTVKLTENPRWDSARPLGILSAANAADVAAGLAFTRKYGLPIALRSGGHSYPGYSAGGAPGTGVRPSLVVDTRQLNGITFGGNNRVTIGAGTALAEVYSTLGARGVAIAGGSCATVGITGLTLGGGVGVLVRNYGLTIDSLTGVEIVTADGRTLTASATENADLFWACRGGGGGHLGIVTSLTYETHPAPTVTMFSLSWNFASATRVVAAWQNWAPTADRRLWSTLKLLNGPKYTSGPGLFVSGTWLGTPSQLAAQLAPFLAAAGAPTSNLSGTHTYADAMARYAGCATIPVAECTTGPGGRLQRESFGASTHMAYSKVGAAGIQQMIEHVTQAKTLPSVVEAGISMDALGGAVADVAPEATAFPHRKALMSVQYTATFANGANPAPLDSYVRGFRSAMVPSWGQGAYVNYADASLADPATSYFAGNATRLASIRTKYDPSGAFSQPQGY